MSMMNFPNGPINSDARDAVVNLHRAESAEAELDAIKRGHGELGRYEQLRLKNAALTAELAKESARLDELDKRGPFESWDGKQVDGQWEPSVILKNPVRSAIDKAMGNP